MPTRRWQLLATAVLTSALMIVPPVRAESSPFSMTCTNGASVKPCNVDLNNNTTLTIMLPNGDQLTARRLGRWNTTTMEGKTQRSCRMRIDLGDDVVYGLLKLSASEGAQLIWSRGRIRVPDFQQPRF